MKRLEKLYKLKKHPTNPRIIKDFKFNKLVESIKDFPEMMEQRPLIVNSNLEVLGGNMRLSAANEAGLKEIWIDEVDWSEDKQKEFMIKDNNSFGEWDWDILANEWDKEELSDWGLDFKFLGDNNIDEEWKGMPEFEQENLNPKKQIIVSFANDKDRVEFSKLINQKITEKTKSIWFPQQEIDSVKDLNY